jgi:N-acetylglucosaminyldiphosphoundecaprenol N-acetyl-beta-D-mannosaminyltransferase
MTESSACSEPIPTVHLLGVRVHMVQIPDVIRQMERWIERRDVCHYIAVTGTQGVMETRRGASFRDILNAADCVVPDGMPLVWLGGRQGFALKRRVYGPELLESFCQSTGAKYRHFFYGGAAGVADRLADTLEERHGIRVAGTHCPPFRPLTGEQDQEILRVIRAVAPDVLWAGLSTPKRERWMYKHRDRLDVPVMAGVGAAFDLNTGRVRQAPVWMREHGLEWSYRLLQEPRRLWRRYLLLGPQFVWFCALELLRFRRFD